MPQDNIPASEKTKEAVKDERATKAQKKAEEKVKKHVESGKPDRSTERVEPSPTVKPEKKRR